MPPTKRPPTLVQLRSNAAPAGTEEDSVRIEIEFGPDDPNDPYRPSHEVQPIRRKRAPRRKNGRARHVAEALAILIVVAFAAGFVLICWRGGDQAPSALAAAADAFSRPLGVILGFIAGAKAAER